MILITKDTSNIAILTLSEKTTLSNVVYLFEVTHDASNDVKYFIAPDTSSNKERYNKITIIENVSELPLVGQVSFTNLGSYTYNVYEQIDTENLSPVGLNLIDKGKLKVVETDVVIPTYSGNQTNYIVYGG